MMHTSKTLCRIGLCFFLLLSAPLFLQAQGTENFSRLSAGEEIPPFLMKYEQEVFSADLERCKTDRVAGATYKKFTRSGAEAMKDILYSGNILFEDPVSAYLKQILDVLLEKEPELRKQIQVYAYKSSAVNAFMLPNGLLLVNLGLIANTTCEAELAYILAHELIHFTECHNLDQYVDRVERKWTQKGYVSDYLEYHARSRTHENEADRGGMERFYKHTPYSPDAVTNAFRILEFAHLPFDEDPVRKEEFAASVFELKEDYFLRQFNPVKSRSLVSDTLSTHPNITARRVAMENLIAGASKEEKRKFIQPEEKYQEIRLLARMESLNQMMIEGEYVEAFYNARIVEKEMPGHPFAPSVKAASLYALSRIRNKGLFKHLPGKSDGEGAYHSATHFINAIDRQELTLLALRESWKALQLDPGDAYMKLVVKDLFKDILTDLKAGMAEFSDYAYGDTSFLLVERVEEEQTKYEKLTSQNKVIPLKEWDMWHYMLADLKQDSAFMKAYEAAYLEAQAEKLGEILSQEASPRDVKRGEIAIFLQDPVFAKFKPRSSQNAEGLSYRKSRSQSLARTIRRLGRPLNARIFLEESRDIHEKGGYQALSLARESSREYRQISDLNIHAWSCRDYIRGKVTPDASLLMQTIVQRERVRRVTGSNFFPLAASAFLNPLLPATLFLSFSGEYQTEVRVGVMDLTTGKRAYESSTLFQGWGGLDYARNFIYQTIYKTKASVYANEKSKY